jgi:hypothetical protein
VPLEAEGITTEVSRLGKFANSVGRPVSTHERQTLVRWVVIGEVAFLFFMGASVALHPGYVLARHEGAISEYGAHS